MRDDIHPDDVEMDDDRPSGFEPVVDGGDLPKFEPTFTLETWDTAEGPVVGVPFEDDVPTPADRVAYVRAAMEQPNR